MERRAPWAVRWIAEILVLVLLAFGRKLGEPWSGILATAMIAGSFVASVVVFLGLLDRPGEDRRFLFTLFTWLPVGGFKVDIGFLVDPLSVTMILFVTGVKPSEEAALSSRGDDFRRYQRETSVFVAWFPKPSTA